MAQTDPRSRTAWVPLTKRLRIVSRSTPTPKATASTEATRGYRCRSGAENGRRLSREADQSRSGL